VQSPGAATIRTAPVLFRRQAWIAASAARNVAE
jgi:hypothetical protein